MIDAACPRSALGLRRRTLLAAGLALAVAGCGPADAPPAAPPPAVGVVTLQAQMRAPELDYTARARGLREVDVRARVSGILVRRLFREGAAVGAGQVLFEIDPAPFAAEVERARGALAVEQARLAEAAANRDRVAALYGRRLVSATDRDAAIAAHAAAAAAVQAAAAALRGAQLDLSYTTVRAPIDGVISQEAVSEGSLVRAGEDSGLLTRIAQIDRLYIDFSLPEAEAAPLRAALREDPRSPRLRLAAADGTPLPRPAPIEFVDARVDPDTGTAQARAIYDNGDGLLSPGQFVQARIEGLRYPPALHLPLRAVLYGVDGPWVWRLEADGTAQPRPVQIGRKLGNLVEIRTGLAAGDRVVVDGILKVQPGAAVKAEPVAADAPPAGTAPTAQR
ncbi:MAG: efflux RND transporter periplasmic adaptor subunit [Gammaproteobacteria bacterium]